MPATPTVPKARWPAVALIGVAAVLVAAGGAVHFREWLSTYRHVPSSIPGAQVVRVGFVLNAAVSVLFAVALLAALNARRRVAVTVIAAAATFEASSLAALLQSRQGTVFGWMETGWTRAATQTLAIEVTALLALGACAVLSACSRPRDAGPDRGSGEAIRSSTAVPVG